MTDQNQNTEQHNHEDADNKADTIAIFFIILILVSTAIYFANQ